ncbi:hypothetical protein OSB04_013198 [Centaurea solstitialis]|uniref:Reverse transcriptase domain-containing protein n=1 Tax=Centaurea solstitialis TaxID=347529 RepID=A0AA38TCT3_9ASTR|nr:hypothetical protein OSB04_013198 [Centaurea solstitialis]
MDFKFPFSISSQKLSLPHLTVPEIEKGRKGRYWRKKAMEIQLRVIVKQLPKEVRQFALKELPVREMIRSEAPGFASSVSMDKIRKDGVRGNWHSYWSTMNQLGCVWGSITIGRVYVLKTRCLRYVGNYDDCLELPIRSSWLREFSACQSPIFKGKKDLVANTHRISETEDVSLHEDPEAKMQEFVVMTKCIDIHQMHESAWIRERELERQERRVIPPRLGGVIAKTEPVIQIDPCLILVFPTLVVTPVGFEGQVGTVWILLFEAKGVMCTVLQEIIVGKSVIARDVFEGNVIELGVVRFRVELIPIPMREISIVLGVDRLNCNGAHINCENQQVVIRNPSGGELTIKETIEMCTLAKSRKYVLRGIHGSWRVVVDSHDGARKKTVADVPVFSEYPDVFLDDLSGIPPERQVEFRIDLVPGEAPVAKAPYRLAPPEMQELLKQLEELLDEGLIRSYEEPLSCS